MKKRIVIIGGGFAGLAAARRLWRYRNDIHVLLVDRRPTADFLPVLPDLLGGRISCRAAAAPLPELARQMNVSYFQDTVQAVDVESYRVIGRQNVYEYDALIIAPGSETNFYGMTNVAENASKLDDCSDATALREALERRPADACIVVGGGYTGIEIATYIRRRSQKAGRDRRVVIVEKLPQILTMCPEWMRDYTHARLREFGIECLTDCTVDQVDGPCVSLSNGDRFEPAQLVWAAGVHAPEFVRNLPFEKDRQGRLHVDRCMQVADGIFAAGDAARVEYKGQVLRMAVQFSISGGRCAAENAARHLTDRPFRHFKTVDPGFIVPMAKHRSCGMVLGARMRGRLPTFLHYFMSVYRSQGIGQKLRLLMGLLLHR